MATSLRTVALAKVKQSRNTRHKNWIASLSLAMTKPQFMTARGIFVYRTKDDCLLCKNFVNR